MSWSVEHHPEVFIFTPAAALYFTDEGRYAFQCGLLFWTVAVEF